MEVSRLKGICVLPSSAKNTERARAYTGSCLGRCNCPHEKQFLAPGLVDVLQQERTTHSLFAISRRTLFYS